MAEDALLAPVRTIRATVEYDGTAYAGFQRQPGRPTIQGALETALTRITKAPVVVAGAGRTDAGVHARGQVVSFRTAGTVPTEKLPVAMNALLAGDIVVRDACDADDTFHARYSAKSRAYNYILLNQRAPSALFGRFSWHVPWELDLRAVKRAAASLVGVHDYTSFSCADMVTPSRVRDLTRLAVRRSGEFVVFEIEANAYLRSMARIIVGTLVEVGQGRRPSREIAEILEARDRRLAGKTAPARGLVLMGVTY